jgi:hypothetical protein
MRRILRRPLGAIHTSFWEFAQLKYYESGLEGLNVINCDWIVQRAILGTNCVCTMEGKYLG